MSEATAVGAEAAAVAPVAEAAVVTPVVETVVIPAGPVIGPSVAIDREYLAAVIRKQCGHSPDMAAQFANACSPEVAIPLEAAARSGDLATVHTLLVDITPK